MEERRKEGRKKVSRRAYSADIACHYFYDCFIRDASSQGCRIFSSDISVIPSPLLLFPEGFKTPKVGVVAWRRAYMAGIHFVSDVSTVDGLDVGRLSNATFPTFDEIEKQFGAKAAMAQRKAAAEQSVDRSNVHAIRDYVASIIHELRTPITSITGALSLVMSVALEAVPQKVRDLIAIAHKNTQRLARLVTDLLDFEKISRGKMKFDLKRCDIVAIVQEAVSADEQFGAMHGVRFRIVDGVGKAHVRADAPRIQQVIANLLSNAAKFSPSGSEVVVKVDRVAGNIRVSVIDKGVGIAKADQARIFDKYAQADSAKEGAARGTGLGLHVCRSILHGHGGTIQLISAPGKGSNFYFELPEASSD